MLPTFVTLFVLVSVLVPDEAYQYCNDNYPDVPNPERTCKLRKNQGKCLSSKAIPLLCAKTCFGGKCPECEDTNPIKCKYRFHHTWCYNSTWRSLCEFTCAVHGIKCNGCPERSPNSYPNTLEYNNLCVWRYNKGKAFNAAENRCTSSEPPGHLASFHSQEQYDSLRGNYTEQEYKGIWIGLRKQSDGRLSWTDGTPADYLPKDVARDGSPTPCYYIQSTLRNLKCTRDNPYICSAPAGSECPDGYTLWNGMCYKFFEDPLEWDDAEEECNKETGGHLAAFQSNEEYTFLKNFHNSSWDVWIGLKHDDGEWTFSNGDNYLYRPRDNDLDAWPGSHAYGAIRAGLVEDGRCAEALSYLCSFEKLTNITHWD